MLKFKGITMTNAKREQLMKDMELMLHHIGPEEFASLTAEVYSRAATDSEGSVAELYSLYASYLDTLNEEESLDDVESLVDECIEQGKDF